MTATAVSRHPWPGDARYLVGDNGTIVGPSGRPLTLYVRPDDGYLQVVIRHRDGRQRSHRVHVMVCETFHGPRPPGHEVRHLDGVPANVRAENLRWATHVENCADKAAHGTAQHGERNGHHRFTEADVLDIRAAARGGESLRSIGRRYDTSHTNVGFIVRRVTWRHLP